MQKMNIIKKKGMIPINLVLALILCNILIFFYQIIIEVFTILCRINGMTEKKSKFQVISVFTGTGFTTDESETMLITNKRRKLTQNMMLFSYIFNVIIVSTLVNLFMSTAKTNINEIRLGINLTIINIFLIFVVKKSYRFKKTLDILVKKAVSKREIIRKAQINVYETYGKGVIAEVELRGKINTAKIKEKYNIQVLMIERKEEIIDKISENTKLEEKDIAIVYGELKNIKMAFRKNIRRKTYDKYSTNKNNE